MKKLIFVLLGFFALFTIISTFNKAEAGEYTNAESNIKIENSVEIYQ